MTTARILLGALIALGSGCGGRADRTAGPAATGGTRNAAGASSVDGGASGASESQGGRGAGGAGASSGGSSVVSAGSGGAAPACDVTPMWWPRSPFVLTMTDPSTGGAAGQSGGEAGAAAEGVSACSVDSSRSAACLGGARVVEAEGTTAFAFDDGSVLSFEPVGAGSIPEPAFAQGRRLWLDYVRTVEIVCSVCGGYDGWTLSIRASEGGEVLWLGRGGNVAEIDPASLLALFGVSERRDLACHASARGDCASFDADVFDHVLATEPEQRLRYGMRTRVDTPNGTFDVMFATATLTGARAPCSDGTPPYGGRDFAASRIEP